MRIAFGFFVLILMLAVIGGLSYFSYIKVNNSTDFILYEAYPSVIAVNDIMEGTTKMALSVRNFLLTNGGFYEEFQIAVNNTKDAIERLYATSVTSEQKARAETIYALAEEYVEVVDYVFYLGFQGLYEEAMDFQAVNGVPLLYAMKEHINEASNDKEAQIYQAGNELNEILFIAKNIIAAVLTVSTISAIALAFFITRSITTPIGEAVVMAETIADGDLTNDVPDEYLKGSDEIGSLARAFDKMINNLRIFVNKSAKAADDTLASSQELAAIAEESSGVAEHIAKSAQESNVNVDLQAAAVQSTSATIEQISAVIENVAENSDTAAGLSEKAVDTTKLGQNAIIQVVKQMDNIGQASMDMKEAINKVTGSSKQISDIVSVIDNISEQTNLLALNTAIEAARAGEAGRGFAIVADEVRKLAEQTGVATQKIVKLISENQINIESVNVAMKVSEEGIKEGVVIVNTAGDKFDEIIRLVDKVAEQIRDISVSIEQIASGSQEVVSAINDINVGSVNVAEQVQSISAVTEEQSAAMAEIAFASQSLSSFAQDVRDIVSRFRV